MLEAEPDAGLGNGGLGRLAACFINSLATMQIPATGYGLRYEYGIFRQEIEDGWQVERPDPWLLRPDPWEVVRPHETVHVPIACSFALEAGRLRVVRDRPSCLLGVPYDRPVVGYGGKAINSLRLWEAASPDYFDFGEFSTGDFVGALVDRMAAETVTRVLYPDDSTSRARRCASCRSIFWSAARWPTSSSAFAAATTGSPCPTRWRSSSTTPIRRWRWRS